MNSNLIKVSLKFEIPLRTSDLQSVAESCTIPIKLGESMRDLVKRTERFVRTCHADQYRKGTAKEPYTVPLKEVTSFVEQ